MADTLPMTWNTADLQKQVNPTCFAFDPVFQNAEGPPEQSTWESELSCAQSKQHQNAASIEAALECRKQLG